MKISFLVGIEEFSDCLVQIIEGVVECDSGVESHMRVLCNELLKELDKVGLIHEVSSLIKRMQSGFGQMFLKFFRMSVRDDRIIL